jgi:hypothetical protein
MFPIQKINFYATEMTVSSGGLRYGKIYISNDIEEIRNFLIKELRKIPEISICYGFETCNFYVIKDNIKTTYNLKSLITYPNFLG